MIILFDVLRNTENRYMMGIILAGGKCGMKDEAGAADYWRAAAAQGDVWSKYRLATLAHVIQPLSAIDLTSSAAAPDDAQLSPRRAAARSLLHAQVLPVTPSIIRTLRCCQSLCMRNGSVTFAFGQDMFMTASTYAADENWAAAAELWEQAAALGHVPSYAALAQIYYEGRSGVARWYDRAAELAAMGAEKGCGDCKV